MYNLLSNELVISYASLHIYTHIHTHTHVHTYTHIHTYTLTHIRTHTYTYIHTHAQTYTHIHIHIYIYIFILKKEHTYYMKLTKITGLTNTAKAKYLKKNLRVLREGRDPSRPRKWTWIINTFIIVNKERIRMVHPKYFSVNLNICQLWKISISIITYT